MLILIAESKTMKTCEKEITPSEYLAHSPTYQAEADAIMKEFCMMQVGEIVRLTKLTPTLALRLFKLAYEFGNKSMGYQAVTAFTGVVFKALDFPTLSEVAKDRCASGVKIISSLYGWLDTTDIIKPYRLDFSSKIISPVGKEIALSSFWKKDVSISLVKEIKEQGHREILNLLPADAAKCIDWKLVKNFAKVWKVDFTDAANGATPPAGKLKEMRGLLLRQILEEGAGSSNDIQTLVSDNYFCDGTPLYPDHLHFLC